MAISIDYLTNIITVPQVDLTLIGGTLYEMDTDQFRKDLNNIADSEEGIVFSDTHIHTRETTIVGITYARFIEIISPYTVKFDPDSQYSVRLAGSNNNIFDVENGILVQNQVQLISNNSAGLIGGIPFMVKSIWEAQHVEFGAVAGSFAELMEFIYGMIGGNTDHNDLVFDGSNRMTSAKIIAYTDSSLTVAIGAWLYTATYNGAGEILTVTRVETTP